MARTTGFSPRRMPEAQQPSGQDAMNDRECGLDEETLWWKNNRPQEGRDGGNQEVAMTQCPRTLSQACEPPLEKIQTWAVLALREQR